VKKKLPTKNAFQLENMKKDCCYRYDTFYTPKKVIYKKASFIRKLA